MGVLQNGRWGLYSFKYTVISKNEKIDCRQVAECEYDYISEFGADGLAFSRRNGCDVYLDKEGTPWAKVKGNLVRVNF